MLDEMPGRGLGMRRSLTGVIVLVLLATLAASATSWSRYRSRTRLIA